MTSEKDGDIRRVNTKEWARSIEYNPVKLFNKVTDKLIGLEGHGTSERAGDAEFFTSQKYIEWLILSHLCCRLLHHKGEQHRCTVILTMCCTLHYLSLQIQNIVFYRVFS